MNKKKTGPKTSEKSEFQFCTVCRINHSQGRRHNFFPRHTNSLSSLFGRFQSKLSNVKSSLKNPSVALPPKITPCSNRFWCIFCDSDIDELGSAFTSGKAIEHLASEDHLRNLKQFLWKYGGGMDKVDSFRITEAEFIKNQGAMLSSALLPPLNISNKVNNSRKKRMTTRATLLLLLTKLHPNLTQLLSQANLLLDKEWEKRCKLLKNEAGLSNGPLHGQSNDIQPNYKIMSSFDKNNMHFLESTLSKDVMPLQYDTNENYQVYYSDISKANKVGPLQQAVASPTPLASQPGFYNWNSTYMSQISQHSLVSTGKDLLVGGFVSSEVHNNQSMANRRPITEGYQNLTQISSGVPEDGKGNVHSGTSPPWLEGIEAHGKHEGDPRVNTIQKTSKKASKLNPKRVGAAWAEKRKLEMEMEKRGEIVRNNSDADWLPNFGRVWQSGTRKESMKEFKKEKLYPPVASQAETEIKLQPYISKRMGYPLGKQ